ADRRTGLADFIRGDGRPPVVDRRSRANTRRGDARRRGRSTLFPHGARARWTHHRRGGVGMNPRVLALLLRPGPGLGGVLALPAIAFALVTTLVLVVVGGAQVFWTWRDSDAGLYQALAAIALVLLVIPLMTL